MGLKEEFLKLLETDSEFRYAIAGLCGYGEILRRFEAYDKKFNEMIAKLGAISEEQTKIWREIASLREEQTKIWEEIVGLREEQKSLREEQKSLREEQKSLREEFIALREDFNRMLKEFRLFDERLGRVERTLEKITVDVEDEARSVLKHRLREMGLAMELTSLILPDLEINLYGVSDDVCLVGEATVRAGAGLSDELLMKFERLRGRYPEMLRKKVILVIYASLPMFELIEKAKERNIWLLKATEEFYRPEKLFIEL